MIYANAETAEDIAQFLRMDGKVHDEKVQAMNVARRLLGRSPAIHIMSSEPNGVIVHAPRQSGKTTELLRYAEEKYPWGQFAVVCVNLTMQDYVIRTHWEIFNRINQSSKVAAKILGKTVSGLDVNPPLMLTPTTLHYLIGRKLPLFVDDWESLGSKFQGLIIETGLFVAAVTS